jgi:hypothetical protein
LRPRHPRSDELRKWFDNLTDRDSVLKPIVAGTDKEFGGKRPDAIRLIAEMNQ